MTITLVDQSEIALHPLDLSAVSQSDPSSSTCVGLIQQEQTLDNPESVADIILGVPFLRSVYMVMAYQLPDSNGIISNGSADANTIAPRLGLLNLTNPTIALEEFNTVRVDNEPLSSSPSASNSSSSGGSSSSNSSGSKLSPGLDALFAILGFFGLCALLFVARWIVLRRKYRGEGDNVDPPLQEDDWETDAKRRRSGKRDYGEDGGIMLDELGLVRTGSLRLSHAPSEDTQKTLGGGSFTSYKDLKAARGSWMGVPAVDDGDLSDGAEFGIRRKEHHERSQSGIPTEVEVLANEDAIGSDTDAVTRRRGAATTLGGELGILIHPSSDSPYPQFSTRTRHYSTSRERPQRSGHHLRSSSASTGRPNILDSPDSPGLTVPLLNPRSHSHRPSDSLPPSSLPPQPFRPPLHHRDSSYQSYQSASSTILLDDLVEGGDLGTEIGMAGVGTARHGLRRRTGDFIDDHIYDREGRTVPGLDGEGSGGLGLGRRSSTSGLGLKLGVMDESDVGDIDARTRVITESQHDASHTSLVVEAPPCDDSQNAMKEDNE